MGDVKRRTELAVGSLLENEGLTSSLDDDAAEILISWGVVQAEMIVQRSEGLDDEAAEELTYAPMRAVRRLMRSVNRWLPKRETPDKEADQLALSKILEQAVILYGDDFSVPTAERQSNLLSQTQQLDVTQSLTALICFLETPNKQPHQNIGATIATGIQPSSPKDQESAPNNDVAEQEVIIDSETIVPEKTVPETRSKAVVAENYRGLWGSVRKTRSNLSNFFFGHL